MRLALWQGTSPAGNLDRALAEAETALTAAAAMGATALVLPEVWLPGYNQPDIPAGALALGDEADEYRRVRGDDGGQAGAADEVGLVGGDRAAAEAGLPADLVEAATLCGPPSYVRERVESLRAAGVTMLNVRPVGPDPVATIAALGEIAG